MNKLLLCLVLTCFQAFSLTHNQGTDQDVTNWRDVQVLVIRADYIIQDVSAFFDYKYFTNSTHSEMVYQRGLKAHRIPDLFLATIQHQLVNITHDNGWTKYYFKVQVQDRYWGTVFNQTFIFQFSTGALSFVDICTFYDETTDLYPIVPPVSWIDLIYSNTTALTYDALPILWNPDLLNATQELGIAAIREKAIKVIGLGNFSAITPQGNYVYLENNYIKILYFGWVVLVEPTTYTGLGQYWVNVKINPDESVAVIDTKIN